MTSKLKPINAPAVAAVPVPRPKNVIKKIYAEDSPGGRRKAAGLTLTKAKRHIAERKVLRSAYARSGLLGTSRAA